MKLKKRRICCQYSKFKTQFDILKEKNAGLKESFQEFSERCKERSQMCAYTEELSHLIHLLNSLLLLTEMEIGTYMFML